MYILGQEITVYTDHKPLLSSKNFRDIINKRFRWISYLEDVGIVIRYIEGGKNVIADYISRHPKRKLDVIKYASIDFIFNKLESTQELQEWQHSDDKLEMVFRCINDRANNELPREFKSKRDLLAVVNNLLTYDHHGHRLIIAPCDKRDDILAVALSHFSGGHFGMFKTHQRILEKFWWPGMFEDVKTFIKNCEICVKVKPLGKRRSKLGKTGIPNKPMDLVSIDYLTELPVS